MTITERTAKHRQTQAEEIRQLRRALLEALNGDDLSEGATYRQRYAELIARANAVLLMKGIL